MKQMLQLMILIVVFSLTGCGNKETKVKDFSVLKGGKTFAVPTGTVADQFVLKRFPDAKFKYFNSVLDCALAVKGGKADAAVYDKPVLQNIAGKNDGVLILPELLMDDKYGFAVQMKDTELKAAIDKTLADLKSNGKYEDMMTRWFPLKGAPAPMPKIELTGTNGTLKFGTAAVTEPMSFVDGDRNVVGFDIEFATYIAQKLGKQIELLNMEFGAMIPALISGKVDMVGAGLSITEERARKVLFSESYYPSGLAVLVKDDSEKQEPAEKGKLRSADDIKDKKIGVLLGSVYDGYTTKTYPKAKILQYQSVADLLVALQTGKIDGLFRDQSSVPDLLRSNPDFGILAKDIFFVPIGAGFNSDNDALREQFNAFLKKIKSNGIYDDMVDRWMKRAIDSMPVIEGITANGTLKAGVVNDLGRPYGFIQNGELKGFDIELSARFAAYCHKKYEPVALPFGSLIASISTNKIDMITASMFITEEREKQIDFGDPYSESGASLIVRKADMAAFAGKEVKAEKKSFLTKVSDSFYNNIILEKRYLLIINGLILTIMISFFAAIFGTMLGGLICWMKMSNNKILSTIAIIYISLLRGTPVLVLLMIIYYIVFASVNINPAVVAVFAFGLNFGAYVSEMFRTSIESIDKGQNEAGIAGGFTKVQTFIHIIAPQALRHLLPVYKGEFISLVKMTSIVGYIAVQDLTKASDIIRSRTFDAFFPLIMAAVLYLIISWLLTWALGYVEISVDPKRKRITRELEAYS